MIVLQPNVAAHDAGLAPWLAVIGYGVAALLAWRVGSRCDGRERNFWWIAAGVLLALGINKQLDLQTELTATLRHIARSAGWYASRRQFQLLFLIGLAIGTVIGSSWLARLVQGLRTPVLITLTGLLALGGFVLMRAASFHHLDVLLGTRLPLGKAHLLIELAALAIVLTGAVLAWRGSPSPVRRPGYHA